jgi:hypothetical protein
MAWTLNPSTEVTGSALQAVGTAWFMTPEQARAVQRAYDRLHDYLSLDGTAAVPSETELEELTYGNFLVAETLTGILAKLRGKSFDQVLDDLPKRDEGYPPGPGAGYMWETAISRLRYLHAHSWQRRPKPAHTHNLATTFRSSFNLVVAAVTEVASETQTTARRLAILFRDAAGVAAGSWAEDNR